jgi:hypothetical protein
VVNRKENNGNKKNRFGSGLACHFCNNDKSDIISYDDYMKYFGSRHPSDRKIWIDELFRDNNLGL